MVSDNTKFHLFAFTLFAILTGIILLFVYLSVVILLMGIEELGLENPYFFASAFMSGGYGFTAIIIVYVLFQFVEGYLDQRRLKVPEVCPECEEKLHSSDVKWIEEERAECPQCGVELRVRKVWE